LKSSSNEKNNHQSLSPIEIIRQNGDYSIQEEQNIDDDNEEEEEEEEEEASDEAWRCS
jgi:hypothetical protein